MFDSTNLKIETETSKQNGSQISLWNVSTQDKFFKLFLIQNSLEFNGVIVVEMQVEYITDAIHSKKHLILLGLLMTTQCTKDIICKCFKIRIIIQF